MTQEKTDENIIESTILKMLCMMFVNRYTANEKDGQFGLGEDEYFYCLRDIHVTKPTGAATPQYFRRGSCLQRVREMGIMISA